MTNIQSQAAPRNQNIREPDKLVRDIDIPLRVPLRIATVIMLRIAKDCQD
ncbi:MAG: hypothetical protein J7604_06915 [Sporocytophaga sp.]|nr:hypothetical protein [Sporocytophaga sp.]MBO9699923.1 hypothetical protein [Sporocytophaga sp.]